MAWYPGMEGGNALGALLFGDVNFSGKLPVTWDTNALTGRVRPRFEREDQMGYWVGYRYFDHQGTALDPSAEQLSVRIRALVRQVQLRELAGSVHDRAAQRRGRRLRRRLQSRFGGRGARPSSSSFSIPARPSATGGATYKELKGFYRVSLAPMGMTGSGKRIKIPLRVNDLKYWDTTHSKWAIEPGTIKVIVAPNANAVATPCANGAGVGCSLSDTFTVTP